MAGAVRAASILVGQITGGILAATIKARFAPNDRVRGFVLSIASFLLIVLICLYAFILVAGFLGGADFERGFLFQMAIGVALISGMFVGPCEAWGVKDI